MARFKCGDKVPGFSQIASEGRVLVKRSKVRAAREPQLRNRIGVKVNEPGRGAFFRCLGTNNEQVSDDILRCLDREVGCRMRVQVRDEFERLLKDRLVFWHADALENRTQALHVALSECAQVVLENFAKDSGASVALKPNLVVAASPETGATTHAGVLSGAIEYLRDHGFRDISIIEGSWVGDDTGRAFRAAGYEAVGKKYGVPLFDLKRDKTRRVDTPLRPMDICCRALDADYLINLPVLKGHCQTAMTCALKNCKGLPARPGEAALPRRGADAPHRRPGRRPAAGADHRGQPLRGSGF